MVLQKVTRGFIQDEPETYQRKAGIGPLLEGEATILKGEKCRGGGLGRGGGFYNFAFSPLTGDKKKWYNICHLRVNRFCRGVREEAESLVNKGQNSYEAYFAEECGDGRGSCLGLD